MDKGLITFCVIYLVTMVMGRHTVTETDEVHSTCLTDQQCENNTLVYTVFDNIMYCCSEEYALVLGETWPSVRTSLDGVMSNDFLQGVGHSPELTSIEENDDDEAPDSKDTTSDGDIGLLDNRINRISSEAPHSSEDKNDNFDKEPLLTFFSDLMEFIMKGDNEYVSTTGTNNEGSSRVNLTTSVETNKNKMPQSADNRKVLTINTFPEYNINNWIKNMTDKTLDESVKSFKAAQDNWQDVVHFLSNWRGKRQNDDSTDMEIFRQALRNVATNTDDKDVAAIPNTDVLHSLRETSTKSDSSTPKVEDIHNKQLKQHKCKKHHYVAGTSSPQEISNDALHDQKQKVKLAENSYQKNRNNAIWVNQNSQRNEIKGNDPRLEERIPLRRMETRNNLNKETTDMPRDDHMPRDHKGKKYIQCKCVSASVPGDGMLSDLLGYLDKVLKHIFGLALSNMQ